MKIGCVIMASGLSRRFGRNKLLELFDGTSLIERILDITGNGLFDTRVVVTRTEAVRDICRSRNVPVIFHEYPNRNDTVRLGIEAMRDVDGCVFCPSDQPMLERESLEHLIRAFSQNGKGMFRLAYGEKQGTPILFGREYFSELSALPEKKGGSYLVKKYPEQTQLVTAASEWELYDVDTEDELEWLKMQLLKKKE